MSAPIITRHLSPYVSEQGPASEINRDRAQVAELGETAIKGQMILDGMTISQLRGEIARLKAEVERMEKVIDWENLRRGKAEKDIATARADALEKAARTAYRICAETRHVTLGDRCENAIRALKEPRT